MALVGATILALVFALPAAAFAQTYQPVGQNYSLTVPPTWRSLDLQPATLEAAMSSLVKADPELGTWLTPRVQQMVAKGVSFIAIDEGAGSLDSGFATNMTVMAVPLPYPMSVDSMAALSVSQMKNVPGLVQPVQYRIVPTSSGPAAVIDSSMMLPNVVTAGRQYMWVTDSTAYIMTFTTTSDQWSARAPIFDTIAESFQASQ
jgi:hypothetical protein